MLGRSRLVDVLLVVQAGDVPHLVFLAVEQVHSTEVVGGEGVLEGFCLDD